jgi:membrane protease YdiL (CAAX protease family)
MEGMTLALQDAPAPPLSRRRAPSQLATVVVVVTLVGVNLANHLLGWNTLWLGPVGAAGLLAFARWSGLTWSQLGLGRSQWRPGLRWGGGVIALVGVIYLAGVFLPWTRSAFLDVRYHLAPAGAVLSALVMIPVGTVLFEEIAFRSVLWGFLSRHVRMWQVALASSLLFGLWHILPAMASAGANQAVAMAAMSFGSFAKIAVTAGTVIFTALGGLVAAELRRRSGSLLASVGMHWATNGLGVLFGLLAWRVAG